MDLVMPDLTTFIQLGIFLFLVVFLSKVLFKPVLQVLEAREQMHVGPKEEAARLKAEAETLREEVYSAISAAKGEAEKVRAESLDQARKSEGEILAQSRKDTEDFLTKTRADIAQQVDKAAQELRAEGDKIGATLVDKLINTTGKGGAA